MKSTIISFHNVSKKYLLHHQRIIGLREAIPSMFKRLFRQGNSGIQNPDSFFALKNCSFEIGKGDAIGIIGHNGAGKTTILKLIARITIPTQGTIITHGKISSLIEIGAGFHGDLTGRENIFLYGSIMGLRKAEIARKFDEIVEFSGLQQFIDTPVKRYSSGMYARLGFSVAAHLDHDILLVDEVLAVGDIAFRQKCHVMMTNMKKSGKSIVFVSHSMPAVEGLCDKSIWLENGEIREYDETKKVIASYVNQVHKTSKVLKQWDHATNGGVVNVSDIKFYNRMGVEVESIKTNDFLTIEIAYQAAQEIYDPEIGISFLTEDGTRVATIGSSWHKNPFDSIYGEGRVQCHIKNLPLLPRQYFLDITIYDGRGMTPYVEMYKARTLIVEVAPDLCAKKLLTDLAGLIYLEANWTVPELERIESFLKIP